MGDMNGKKVGFITLGCRVNQYETKAIAEYLERRGFVIGEENERCDAYVVNTCAVTAESERKSRQMIRRAAKLNPEASIIVTGCASQLDPEKIGAIQGVRYVGGNTDKLGAARALIDILENKDRTGCTVGNMELCGEYENYAVRFSDHTRAYVKIEDGCDNRCAYCVISKLRGPVRSKPRADVVSECRELSENGFKEIVLTGIEICSYQFGLVELMKELSEIDGIERIRLSSVNPAFINEKFALAIKDLDKVCPHFHLSLQSCCDKTLNAMRRRYNTKMLLENCAAIRRSVPHVCFTADIICGFPGESDTDFEITLENTEKIGLLSAHIFPYSKRPGTEAALMDGQVEESIKQKRCETLRKKVAESRDRIIDGYIDSKKVFRVLFETYKDGFLFGHTENFISVRVRGEQKMLNTIRNIIFTKINEGKGDYLVNGVII